MTREEKIKQFFDTLLARMSAEEQIQTLRHCLELHALNHPWVDEEVSTSILENIANEYEVTPPFGEGSENG